jgi:hypothetical protein
MDWVVEDDPRKQITKIHNSFICKQPRGESPPFYKKYEKQTKIYTKTIYKNKTSNYRCQCLFKFIIRIANNSLW